MESKLSIWCYVKIYDSLNDNNWNFHLYEDENLTFNALLKLGHNKAPLREKKSADFMRSSSVKFHNECTIVFESLFMAAGGGGARVF